MSYWWGKQHNNLCWVWMYRIIIDRPFQGKTERFPNSDSGNFVSSDVASVFGSKISILPCTCMVRRQRSLSSRLCLQFTLPPPLTKIAFFTLSPLLRNTSFILEMLTFSLLKAQHITSTLLPKVTLFKNSLVSFADQRVAFSMYLIKIECMIF